MDIYETSSPSYVIMASIENAQTFKNSESYFKQYKILLDNFYNKVNKLGNIHLLKMMILQE